MHNLSLFLRKNFYQSSLPPAKSVFGIHDPMSLSQLTHLRVGLSKLNFHKFRHNFRDTVNPMCPTKDGVEDTEHILLLCPSFVVQRRNLLAGILPIELTLQFIQEASRLDFKRFSNTVTNHSTTKDSFFAIPFCLAYLLLFIFYPKVMSGFVKMLFHSIFLFLRPQGCHCICSSWYRHRSVVK